MLLAISNTATSAQLINAGAIPNGDQNVLLDYTFDTNVFSDSIASTFLVWLNCPGEETYVAIGGHNLGSLGATLSIVNHDIEDVTNYAPIDDRPLMFAIPARTGGEARIRINITKQNVSDVIIISHAAVGNTTDLTSTTTHGQVIERDYESNFPMLAMNLNRKVRATVNDRAAPTATLIKEVVGKARLNINNVAKNFARNELLEYQRFWTTNGFFIQFDEDETQTIMATQFIPNAPKAHGSTREIVNLSYSFNSYNGQ